nr:hypothetical protein Iba_chr11bCG11940 [Ipomoea batatas]
MRLSRSLSRLTSMISSGRPRSTPMRSLSPPRYDLTEKYTPKRAVVTVAVGPPPSRPSSSRASRYPPAPATKISLGSKKNEPPKTENSGVEALVPTRLPLTATHPASPSGEKETSRTASGGRKEVLEDEEVLTLKRTLRDGSGSTNPVIDMLMKHGDEPPAALLTRICAAASPPEQISDWSTTLASLEALVDEDDLPKLLAVLPEDVPYPRAMPFSKVPDEQASESAAGASTGPTTETVAEPSAEPPKGGE